MMAAPMASPIWSYWRELLLLLAAYGVVIGVIVRAVAKDQFMATLERCKDPVIAFLNRAYKERDERIEQAVQSVAVLEDQVEGIEASVKQQGIALTEQVKEQHAQTTRALEAMTATLGAIQDEAKAMAVGLGEIRGELRVERAHANDGEWDGTERRKRRRRRKPSPEDGS